MNTQTMTARAMKALRPPPRLRLSDWLERDIRLPEGVSALPGKVRLYPYQREIADAIGDTTIERVTLVKAVRVGFTTLLTGAVGSFVANDPAPIIALLPTDDDARDYVVSDIEPIFAASPVLAGLLSGDTTEGQRDTMMSRRFPGGSLKVLAAKAPRNLRRHNARVLFIDEADAMSPTPEGSPLMLAERRTLSFPDRKIVIGSTPIDTATSNVLRAYAQSDQRVFEVPCPDCGHHHEIKWADIRWPDGEPAKAYYACPECGSCIEERQKAEMVANGRWRATAPHVAGHAGFRINALVSPLANAAWGKLATEFLAAKDDPDTLRTFINTILAEGTGDDGDTGLDEVELLGRVEPFGIGAIPPDVLYLTVGVDVQDDRLEAAIVGWDREGTAYVLDHQYLWGSPGDNATWSALDELLTARWRHPLGGMIGVDAACVDSGDGDWTTAVYRFCHPRARRRVMAIKGMAGSRAVIERSKSKSGGGPLWIVGVDGVKRTIVDRLTRGVKLRFSDSLPLVWFEQLASERRVVRYSRGQPVARWERKPGRAAEALDCTVYAFAARQVVGSNFDNRDAELRQEQKPVVRPRTIKSEWMNQ
ncbi:phage terminase large subunit family protein [Aurantimonas coralicida]|uniref:phage terminase large subunit family protein n=1 Tax=Aurantimonas coralicida TaxID=182270 RepID=UPI001E32668C|nr:phage terminase large subunit family protein [Aurantimonas coralicida]MCD1642469.1 phage terminase large subunit family protein [Aurantimonas coralicida]